MPLVKRLRFIFIDFENRSKAKPDEGALMKQGRIQFAFTGTEDELTSDLRARFDLVKRSQPRRSSLVYRLPVGRHPYPGTGTF